MKLKLPLTLAVFLFALSPLGSAEEGSSRFTSSNYSRSGRMRSKRSVQLEGSTDMNYMFPVPKIQNVYKAWKPIDYGHPLVDATIHYAPPELERVHIGKGPVPIRPPQANRNLVFEAAREVDGRKNNRLKANVYASPRIDKPYKGLVPRDTVVTIPSQRRNSIIHQDHRHGRTEGKRKIDHLKSGIYYVDDPYEKFREKPKQRDPPSGGFNFLDRFFDAGVSDYQSDEPDEPDQGVRFIPVSLLSTPPTITTTDRPYGEIVNKDFYDLSTLGRKPKPVTLKSGRKVTTSSTNTLYPLGNPYYGSNSNARPQYYPDQAPVSNSRPPRLEGVLGPRIPQLQETPRQIVNFQRSAGSSWAPSNNKYHGKGREIEYRKEPIIYQVKDSGELVDPNNGRSYIENDYDQASSGSYQWSGSREPQEQLSSNPQAQDFNATESDSGDLQPEAYPVVALQDTPSKSELKGTADDSFAGGFPAPGQLPTGPAGPGGYDTQDLAGVYQGDISARSVDEEMTHSGYSRAQIYYLCTTEVPEYLQKDLCKLPKSLQNDRSNPETSFSDRSDNNVHHTELIDQTRVPHTALIDERHGTPSLSSSSTFPSKQGTSGLLATFPRNHGSPTFFRAGTHVIETQTTAYDSPLTSLRTVSVRLPPKSQFQFVQDNQYVSTTEPMLQERALPKLTDENNQEPSPADQGQVHSSPETPFPYVKGPTDGGPAPIIYSVAQSKVAVYRPNELTTTTEPPTSSSAPEPVSSSTAKPFHYQAPLTNPPIYSPGQEFNQFPAHSQSHFGKHPPVVRKRPLIYAKRRPEGPAQVSRPFDYLSRLSHFLSDRVFTGRTKLRKKSGEFPALITRRLEGSVS